MAANGSETHSSTYQEALLHCQSTVWLFVFLFSKYLTQKGFIVIKLLNFKFESMSIYFENENHNFRLDSEFSAI
jgi:hypothetical protein